MTKNTCLDDDGPSESISWKVLQVRTFRSLSTDSLSRPFHTHEKYYLITSQQKREKKKTSPTTANEEKNAHKKNHNHCHTIMTFQQDKNDNNNK